MRAAVRRAGSGEFQGVEVVSGCDLETDDRWPTALESVGCVVHCAARVHVMSESAADPLAAFRQANVEGTLRVARAAVNAGVRRFVFLSTVKVMGESTTGHRPFSEADEPAPEDAYGQSKREAEQALRALAAKTGLEVVVVRCPLVYGPGVAGNFRNLIRLADSSWPLPLGGIRNARSMVFVGNLVDFVIHVSTAEVAAGQTFLVSDGSDLSTSQLVGMIREELDRPVRLFPAPWVLLGTLARLAGKEPVVSRLTGSLQVDITRARQLLGWEPPYTVHQGIGETLRPDMARC